MCSLLQAVEEKLRRQQLVARLPNITRLNGSAVTESERVDAERAFIRLFMDSEEKPDRSEPVHTHSHVTATVHAYAHVRLLQ